LVCTVPELLGKLYLVGVQEKLNTTKWHNDVDGLITMLKRSFRTLLNESIWMNQDTKIEATAKLDSMSMNIGYPDWYMKDFEFTKYSAMVRVCEMTARLVTIVCVCPQFSNISQNDYFSSVVNVSEASQLSSTQELNERLYFSALIRHVHADHQVWTN